MPSPRPQRPKRRQVKNACTNCQKACKKCDDARPCLRCVKYGTQEGCVSSQRKERKKGLKRGPYKKRDAKVPPPSPPLPASSSSAHPPYITEPPALYPPCLFAQLQPPPIQPTHTGHEPLATAYPLPPPYYSAAFLAQFSPSIYPQYPIPPPDAQLLSQNVHYTIHGTNPCAKLPGQPGRSDVGHGHCPL